MCQQVLGLQVIKKKKKKEEGELRPLRDWTLAKGAIPSS